MGILDTVWFLVILAMSIAAWMRSGYVQERPSADEAGDEIKSMLLGIGLYWFSLGFLWDSALFPSWEGMYAFLSRLQPGGTAFATSVVCALVALLGSTLLIGLTASMVGAFVYKARHMDRTSENQAGAA